MLCVLCMSAPFGNLVLVVAAEGRTCQGLEALNCAAFYVHANLGCQFVWFVQNCLLSVDGMFLQQSLEVRLRFRFGVGGLSSLVGREDPSDRIFVSRDSLVLSLVPVFVWCLSQEVLRCKQCARS